jgi:hypothetical protein
MVLSILFSIPFTSDYNYVLNSNISSSMGFPLSLSLSHPHTWGGGVWIPKETNVFMLAWRSSDYSRFSKLFIANVS